LHRTFGITFAIVVLAAPTVTIRIEKEVAGLKREKKSPDG